MDRDKLETAVITAAGRGTRLLPATAAIPKVMLPLVTVPAVQLVVTEAIDAGLKRIVLVVGEGGNLIRKHFDKLHGPWQGCLVWVEQLEPLGLGHAICCARGEVGEQAFALMLGDAVFLEGNPTRTLADDFRRHGETVLGLQRVPQEHVAHRGVIEVEGGGRDRLRARRMIEKPAPGEARSDLALVGRAVFRPSIFAALETAEPDSSGEIPWTEGINAAIASEPVAGIVIEEDRLDIGNPPDYFRAVLAFGRTHLAGDL